MVDSAIAIFVFLFGGVGLLAVPWLLKRWRNRTPSVRMPTLDELRRTAKLLVVDDKEFDFLDSLKQSGYKVKSVADISTTKDIEAGAYDLVLIDLSGIGAGISKEQGLGVIRQVKSASPAQVVIAYSAARWPLATSNDVRIADVVIDKARVMFPEFREIVDAQVLKSASLVYYVDSLAAITSMCNRQRVSDQLARYIADREGSHLESIVQDLGLDPGDGAIPSVHSIAKIAKIRLRKWMN